MELFVLYEIKVVLTPMVRTEQRYKTFSDGLQDIRYGGKFKSLIRFPRNILNQHALVENDGRGVRVVP